jgi:hypothetical protein
VRRPADLAAGDGRDAGRARSTSPGPGPGQAARR